MTNIHNIQLFHKPNSRSQRIVWLFEELHLPYQLHLENSSHETPFKQQHLKFPTVHFEQNQQQFQLTESSAIATYFSQFTQQLDLAPQHPNFKDYCFYQHYADASLMPNLALKQVFAQIAQQTPWLLRFVSLSFKKAFNQAYLNPELYKQLHDLDQHLQHNPWLAGEQFTIADLLLWFPLHASQYAYPNFAVFSALEHYLQQIKNRPAFIKASLRGQWSNDIFKQYWKITQ